MKANANNYIDIELNIISEKDYPNAHDLHGLPILTRKPKAPNGPMRYLRLVKDCWAWSPLTGKGEFGNWYEIREITLN